MDLPRRIPPPSVSDHLDQARDNVALHEMLLSEPSGRFLDWAVVALFYAALHLVEAHARHSRHDLGDNHKEVRDYIDRHLASIRRQYRDLFDASRDARYLCWNPPVDEVRRLRAIEYSHVQAQLRNRGVSV